MGIIVPTLKTRKLRLREAPGSTPAGPCPQRAMPLQTPVERGPGFLGCGHRFQEVTDTGGGKKRWGRGFGHLCPDPLSLPLVGPQALTKQ